MKMVTLADCCEIVSGATPKTGVAEYWDGDVDWATPADLSKLDGAYIDQTPRKITRAGLASCAATLLPAGAVLLSSRAPIGHVAINTRPMATNQGFKSLVPRAAQVDPKYLYHWFIANVSYLQSLGNGATFKELSKATVSRVELPLPPLDEQGRIAAILDQADSLRAKRRHALAHLDDLTQSIFLEMFSESPGYQMREFGQVCERLTVGVVIKPASHYVESGVPAMRTLNVRPGRLDLTDIVYFSKESNDGPLRKSKLRTDDLVIARTGQPGTTAIVPKELDGANAIDLIVVTPNQRHALPIYLETLLNSVLGKRMVVGQQRGQIQQHFNVGSLRPSPIPVPPLPKQFELRDRLRNLNRLRDRHLEAVASEGAIFASLQSRAFSGQL